jgi:hypothetical protein
MPYKDPEERRETVLRSRDKRQQLAVVESNDLPQALTWDGVLRVLSREAKKGHVGGCDYCSACIFWTRADYASRSRRPEAWSQ